MAPALPQGPYRRAAGRGPTRQASGRISRSWATICWSPTPRIIRDGIARGACTAAVIKPDQIGTVSETIEAVPMCHAVGWKTMISHHSGETIDDFIADFAVAMSAGQSKSGAPCRGEQLAKYSRLIEIERQLGARAEFHDPFQRD